MNPYRFYRYHRRANSVIRVAICGGLWWALCGFNPLAGFAICGGIWFVTMAADAACEEGKEWAERELGEGEEGE